MKQRLKRKKQATHTQKCIVDAHNTKQKKTIRMFVAKPKERNDSTSVNIFFNYL